MKLQKTIQHNKESRENTRKHRQQKDLLPVALKKYTFLTCDEGKVENKKRTTQNFLQPSNL